MRGKVRFLALLMAVVMLAGCSASSSKGTLYSDYISNIMACSYYGDTDGYVKVCEATVDEAKDVHDSTVEYYAWQLMDFNGVDSDYVSDEMQQKYIELAREVMAKVKYTVNKATKVNGEYQVKVEIQPVDFNDITYDAVEKCVEDYNTEMETLDTSKFTEADWEEYEERYAQAVYDVLTSYVPSIGYKETVSKIVIISVDSDGYYGISDDEWNDIDDIVVDMKY